MADADLVLLAVRDGVATLTLNRPESLNAWTPAMEDRWNELLDLLATDDEVRALVVTGAGRGFCAGADRNALGRRARGEEARPVRQRPLTSVLRYPKPVIAAINGACVGLGLALALCCDVRFATSGAKFSAPFARLGLPAEFRTPWLLPRLVGTGSALDLLLSGRILLAEEALQIGLIQRILGSEELLPAATAYAAEIAASCSPTRARPDQGTSRVARGARALRTRERGAPSRLRRGDRGGDRTATAELRASRPRPTLVVRVTVAVGMRIPYSLFEQDARALRAAVARAEASGLDHVCMGDHVSFHGGQGFDGLLQAAALASLTSTMKVETAVYLLALRHPVAVARQVATVAQLAPGRFVFGVGLGGEDRHELEICGVDPSTRGRRLDECLTIVRALLAGETVDFAGRIFQIEQAAILPTPAAPVPIVIGGRPSRVPADGTCSATAGSDCSSRPSAIATQSARSRSWPPTEGRGGVEWYHGMHLWCGVGPSPDLLADAMESLYQTPFERFERYTPYGTPEAIADYVRPISTPVRAMRESGARRRHTGGGDRQRS